MSERFDSGFPKSTPGEWRLVAERGLGGRSYEELSWQTDEGFSLPPVVAAEPERAFVHSDERLQPLLRRDGPWRVRERIAAPSTQSAANQAGSALAGGADELLLQLDFLAQIGVDPTAPDRDSMGGLLGGAAGIPIYRLDDLDEVLTMVDPKRTRVAIEARSSGMAILGSLFSLASRRDARFEDWQIELGLDPMHEVLLVPPRGESTDQLLAEMVEAFRFCDNAPHVVPIAIHGHEFHRSGADVAMELACVLATGATYLRTLTKAGFGVGQVLAGLSLRLPVGTELYLEIAKLRAARLCWAKLACVFGASSAEQLRIPIHAETSERARALWTDVRCNLVRTTVQGFAAVAAGCDSLTVLPFDAHGSSGSEQEASARLARNQQLLLREESYLDKVQDPLAGATAIEDLTDRVCRSAWSLYEELEAEGGIFEALRTGSLQKRISATAEQRADSFRTRRRNLVGISRYVDPIEAVALDRAAVANRRLQNQAALNQKVGAAKVQRDEKEALTALESVEQPGPGRVERIANALAAGATFAEVYRALRGDATIRIGDNFNEYTVTDGMEFESLRNPPIQLPVLLLSTGDNQKLARARGDFVRDVLHAGNFRVKECGHVVTIADAVEFIQDADAILTVSTSTGESYRYDTRIIALCGDDQACDKILAELAKEFEDERETLFLLTGRPRAQKHDLVDWFLFDGMDVPEFLDDLFRRVFATPFARWQAGI